MYYPHVLMTEKSKIKLVMIQILRHGDKGFHESKNHL